jgi:hypothetical protein
MVSVIDIFHLFTSHFFPDVFSFSFSSSKNELFVRPTNNHSAFNFDNLGQDQATTFDNTLIDRFELSTLLESFYRRDLAALFKIAELGAHDSFIKIDGINYQHPCFMLGDKFQKRNEVNVSFQGLSGDRFGSSQSNKNKADSNAFDIDALIEMTYNS